MADRAAADFRLELLQGGEFRQLGPGGTGLWRFLPGCRLRGRRLGPALRPVAGLEDDEIAAARGARQQHVFQRHGAQDAAREAGEDGGNARGAEELRDDGEAAGGGAVLQGCREVAAVFEQDADEDEDRGDALGHGFSGAVLLGTLWGRKTGGGVRGGHGQCMLTNWRREVKGFFPRAGAGRGAVPWLQSESA